MFCGLLAAGIIIGGSTHAPDSLQKAQGGVVEIVRARAVPVTDIVLKPDIGAHEELASHKRSKARSEPEPATPDPKPEKTAPVAAAAPAAKDAGQSIPSEAAAQPPPKVEWTADEITAALKECVRVVAPLGLEVETIAPLKTGACGTPAPLLLKSVGTKEKVTFEPPVEVNCKLAAELAEWVEKSLQPAAREALASPIVKISGASGYACRNRYGLADAPLSEHALANAVDVPAFVLADGRTIKVVSGWGPTARDIAARNVAVKGSAVASADKGDPDAKKQTNGEKSKDEAQKLAAVAVPAKSEEKPRKLAALKGVTIQRLGAGSTLAKASVESAGQSREQSGEQSRDLGRNLKRDTRLAPPPELSAEARFLRTVAKSACASFGTVLGPEANEAHRDHFHLDMKARRNKAYCQ